MVSSRRVVNMAKSKDNQKKLLKIQEWWEDYWQDMPEFIQEDKSPYRTIKVHFENKEDMAKFSELVCQKITELTKSIWYPKVEVLHAANFTYKVDSSEK